MIRKIAAVGLVLCGAATGTIAADRPIIDTHAHIELQSLTGATIEATVERMRKFGITHTILMSPPRPPGSRFGYEADDLRGLTDRYAGRFSVAGGGGGLNAHIGDANPQSVTDADRGRFRERAQALARNKDIVGFGEITVSHLSLRGMGEQHAYQASPPDHPLMLVLADVAASLKLPIDLHIDLVPEDMDLPKFPNLNPSNPARLQGNQAAFERLLAYNRDAKIIWAHAGNDPLRTRNPQVQRGLLERHPNLYMSVRLTVGAPPPSFALDGELKLKPFWLELFKAFPERFVLGSDVFHGVGVQRGPQEGALANFRILLDQLPPELADNIAYRNAQRLFNLPALAAH